MTGTAPRSSQPNPGALRRLFGGLKHEIRAFVRAQRRRPVEIIPSGQVIFAVVGDPDRDLELYWLSDAGQYRLLDIVRARGLSSRAAQSLGLRLRSCHASHADAPRQVLSVAQHRVAVVSSERYGGELRRVVSEAIG